MLHPYCNWIISCHWVICSLFNRLSFIQLARYSLKSNYLSFNILKVLTVPMFIFSYVEFEHIRHCVPSNVSSGLGKLPLKYVWLDGIENTSLPTDPYLPTGEALNGSWAYSQIMSYFTTNTMTPAEVHELGKKQLSILYPMVSLIADECLDCCLICICTILNPKLCYLEFVSTPSIYKQNRNDTIWYGMIQTLFRRITRNNWLHLWSCVTPQSNTIKIKYQFCIILQQSYTTIIY